MKLSHLCCGLATFFLSPHSPHRGRLLHRSCKFDELKTLVVTIALGDGLNCFSTPHSLRSERLQHCFQECDELKGVPWSRPVLCKWAKKDSKLNLRSGKSWAVKIILTNYIDKTWYLVLEMSLVCRFSLKQ